MIDVVYSADHSAVPQYHTVPVKPVYRQKSFQLQAARFVLTAEKTGDVNVCSLTQQPCNKFYLHEGHNLQFMLL